MSLDRVGESVEACEAIEDFNRFQLGGEGDPQSQRQDDGVRLLDIKVRRVGERTDALSISRY